MRLLRWRLFFPLGLAAMVSQLVLCQATSAAGGATLGQPAAPFFEEADWQAVCSRALASDLPAEADRLARAAASHPDSPAGPCDEQALYYGFGKPPDYPSALQCAYWHRAHPKASGFLQGAGTLAMLYANGDSVPRDYTLAIQFACEANRSGGQNTEERIGVLEALRDGKLPSGARFDLCDEQMSGAMGAYCSGLAERQDDARRATRIDHIRAQLPLQAQGMLPRLQGAESAFEQARIHGEYPGGGGSGSVGLALGDQNLLREQFVINLEHFAAGRIPKAPLSRRLLAQQELEAAYAAALAVLRDPQAPFGSPTLSGLKATQAAWQALFAQWMDFVPIAFPHLDREAAATELLRLRIHQLKRATY